MAQVILHLSPSGLGNVAVCVPSGEVSIEQYLSQIMSEGFSDAFIADSSILPTGSDDAFFDAWELNGRSVSVNFDKAKAIANRNLNNMAKQEVTHRTTNAGIGVENKLSDADWLALLSTARSSISSATTTQQLLDALIPVKTAITANA
jgi:hypothetical protein